ncbi:MAG TPA: VOC family protein [Acidimicrobiales bacterium]|nr:VOC family protein [Acidimicrobiales bacterium]
MAITGAHVLINTSEPEALRAVFRDVFGMDHVDAGGGWLIFNLPPAELGVHPSGGQTDHALSFMCDDIDETMAELKAKGITFLHEPTNAGFGIETMMELPGGVTVQLYQPRHPTAI